MSLYLLGFIATMAIATFATRALPFLLFRRGGEHPLMLYIGRYLPAAIMLLLVVYCLKDVDLRSAPHGAPELLSLALVVVLHLLWRNALVSIAGGTAVFMLLVQSGMLAG